MVSSASAVPPGLPPDPDNLVIVCPIDGMQAIQQADGTYMCQDGHRFQEEDLDPARAPHERGMWGIPTSEILSLARSIGIRDAGTLDRSELDQQIKAKLAGAAARHEQRGYDYAGMSLVKRVIIDHLYEIDQSGVATAVSTLRMAAQDMLGHEARDLDLFGREGDRAVGDNWDVLQNYAQEAFARAEAESRRRANEGLQDESPKRDYPWELIAAWYDPAWRRAFGEWAEQNADLLPDSEKPIAAFEYVASGNLDSYVREYVAGTPELHAVLSAGRLPFPPELAVRSPELARLAAHIWRITSTDSPAYRQLFASDRQFRDGPLPDASPAVNIEADPVTLTTSEDPPTVQPRRSHAQAEGARLEQGMQKIFERLFRIETGTWQADIGEVRRPRAQVRRQRSGTQYGADIVIRFKGAAVGASSTCLAECKNYTADSSGLTVSTVAEKVLQAEANFDAEPVDHWILISPNLDPNNELDRLVERWNAAQRFPFTIQIWSPQTGVRQLFAIDPDIYRSLYGGDPPEQRRDAADILAEYSERLRPPVRLPEPLRKYVQNPRSFTEKSEEDWLKQLATRIERFGFDEKGAPLGRPLEDEILSVLVDSPTESNAALLLADFGEGKSFFTVSLCVRLQERYLGEPRSGSPIPVRLPLRSYRHLSDPADFLSTGLGLRGLTIPDWAELQRGNVLVVLDGLDEMSVRQDPDTTRANLDKIGSLLELLEGIPVLVTSRPHFFASGTDRERFYDRLRRPHVFRMGQPDRRDTVTHLRAYADSLNLAPKLNKIKELYDPIGLAGKVLFLEMIKQTLPDLPEDHFDELELYKTYVKRALNRKLGLLRDLGSAMTDAELLDSLEKLLERIAIAIHISSEGGVDLREFVTHWGGAARLLWQASQPDPTAGNSDDDASARIGSRSLLRRVGPENEERWLVDFFHRSMKEYFVAKALHEALNTLDPYAATRDLLLKVPVQPEILGFFRLLAGTDDGAATVLAVTRH